MVLAFGMVSWALALGGYVPLICLGLVFAAASMALFERARPERGDS
jgi:hypothetical protein